MPIIGFIAAWCEDWDYETYLVESMTTYEAFKALAEDGNWGTAYKLVVEQGTRLHGTNMDDIDFLIEYIEGITGE